MLSKLAAQLRLDLLEVEGLHGCARPAVDLGLVADDTRPQGLGEAAHWLAEIALEELHYGGREVKLLGTVDDILRREAVGSHPLGEVADHLGGRRDLTK